ncbi:MAG: maleylacetoacetate isomerase [Pseudomonadota bacterium]
MATAKLHGYYRSSTTYRTRIALNLKGIEFESVDVRLDKGAQHTDEFHARNPMGAVPVLEIDDLQLLQSPAIIDYLEEQYPTPALLPAHAMPRQRAREFSALIGCDIHPVNNLRILNHLRSEYDADSTAIGRWNRHWMSAGFTAFETLLGVTEREAAFCVGDQITMAECYLIPQLYNARRFELDLTPFPCIVEVERHCLEHPAFVAAHPDRFKPND